MSRGIEIQFRFFDESRLDEFFPLFDEKVSAAMRVVTSKIAGDAIQLSPVDRGFFQNSIQTAVEFDQKGAILGSVFSTAAHAPIIEGVDEGGNETEFGRRPGARFPNVGELRLWVERVISPPEQKIDEVTYLVGRKIVQQGIKPVRPIGTAFKNNLEFAYEELERAIDETVAEF